MGCVNATLPEQCMLPSVLTWLSLYVSGKGKPAPVHMKFKHLVEYGLMRAIIFPFTVLPLPIVDICSSFLAWIIWVIWPFRLNIVFSNLTTIFPEMSRADKLKLAKMVFLEAGRTAGRTYILHRKPLAKLIEEAEVRGLDILNKALEQGKGVIMTTSHGNWLEAYVAWFNRRQLPSTLIYQKQKNPLTDAFFLKQRQRHGSSLEQLTSKAGMERFEQALAANRVLIVCIDQSYKRRGVEVPFFERPFKCAKGTSVLHMRTQAPILTSFYYLEKGRLCIEFEEVTFPAFEEIDEKSMAKISAETMQWYEPHVRKHPEQWFGLFHRLWDKSSYPKKIPRSFKEIFFL